MRCFIAIELPAAIHEALEDAKMRLRAAHVKASWVKPGNVHLTLRFLGEIEEVQAARIAVTLEEDYEAVPPFRLRVQGLGAFPTARRPSVLWAGCGPLDTGLSDVQQKAEAAARAVGLDAETKAFRPHLTLARIRDRRSAGPVAAALERQRGFDGGEFEVSAVALFESRLSPAGAEYTRLKEFRF